MTREYEEEEELEHRTVMPLKNKNDLKCLINTQCAAFSATAPSRISILLW